MYKNSLCLILCVTSVIKLSTGSRYRLPTTIEPLFYKLKIIPNLDSDSYTGEVSIEINVKDLVKSVILHSANLTLNEVKLDRNSKNICYKFDSKYDLLELSYEDQSKIAPGNHHIFIKYNGTLGADDELGFIKAKFTHKNQTNYLAVTDFQPTYARSAFPCFDEPRFKSKFQLSLGVPNDTYTALSNMEKIGEFRTESGVIIHKFQTSVVMSSYLVAFAVTQYKYNELIAFDGIKNVPIRGYSFKVLDVINNTADRDDFCKHLDNRPLCIAAQSMNFFTRYLDYHNPLYKVDFIEYNREASGATENWGLITIRKGLVRLSLGIYTEGQTADVVAHEIAHFWFGNLVTNDWWDDIWLQEGFAVFMSLKVQDFLHPRNNSKIFPSQYLEDVYLTDQQGSPSNPVVKFVESPDEIMNHFSDITYTKGAAVLRMIEMVLGEENFKESLREYIKTFAYKTATTNDLITIFEKFSNKNVDLRSFIQGYLYQSRYPLLEITEDLNRNVYIVHQISCSYKKNDSSNNYRWTIPITYFTDLNKNPTLVWFYEEMDTLEIPKNNEKWIKFNQDQIGFYRVKYGESVWAKLEANLEELDNYERDHILAEVIQLYFSDLLPCEVPLKLLLRLHRTNLLSSYSSIYILFYLNQEEMTRYDKEAVKILNKFVTGQIFKMKHLMKREANEISIVEAVPERVKVCAEWIKNNMISIE